MEKNDKSTIRLGEERLNNQGCLMRIIEYNNANDIVVKFQDERGATVNTKYQHFLSGNIKNPYIPSVFEIGITGNKYITSKNYKLLKEYKSWCKMLERCFSEKYKKEHPTYKDVTCCDEWLLYENFYEWLHGQENFEKWLNGDRWAVDKDILVKGNKIYSPETCCLVPVNVNTLFVKNDSTRGKLPIGVRKNGNGFITVCKNPFTKSIEYFGTYTTIEETFQSYKNIKEYYIKQVAHLEYEKGNISKKCYDAMLRYEVEITD